jgi:Flp pilus assembly protein TadG
MKSPVSLSGDLLAKWFRAPILLGEEGSSVLELALVMPMLMLLFVGAMDFGQAYYVGIEVTSAAEAGTSYGVANPTDMAGMASAATLDAADVPTMVPTASWGCECSDGTAASISCVASPSCVTNVVNYVDVKTTVTYKPMLIWPAFPSSFTIAGHSRMRVAP